MYTIVTNIVFIFSLTIIRYHNTFVLYVLLFLDSLSAAIIFFCQCYTFFFLLVYLTGFYNEYIVTSNLYQ